MRSVPSTALRWKDELARLGATVTRTFADSVDLDRANAADPQGIGGPSHAATTL